MGTNTYQKLKATFATLFSSVFSSYEILIASLINFNLALISSVYCEQSVRVESQTGVVGEIS